MLNRGITKYLEVSRLSTFTIVLQFTFMNLITNGHLHQSTTPVLGSKLKITQLMFQECLTSMNVFICVRCNVVIVPDSKILPRSKSGCFSLLPILCRLETVFVNGNR